MKIRVPMMVDDGRYAPLGRADATEGFDIDKEDYFLDGPVTRRVAVLDFEEQTGRLIPGVKFKPPREGRVLGYYDLSKPLDIASRTFNQVSVFATVMKTIYMFEEPETLGRPIRWALDAPQLLVIPRAGQMENAFYERDSHSLQFFYFPSHQDEKEIVYTSLARDIVAHETGHAILDGIAPHLWNAITPQCLALHEAIGDLSALLLSIDSNKLRKAVLKETQGSIRESTHFSALAEQFGMATRGSGALRSLYDGNLTLSMVNEADPHDLCRVLTAALYSVLVKMHEDRKQEEMAKSREPEYSVSGKALAIAAGKLRRMTLRALDYLPPGEVSFADYCRAVIAADQASYPDDHKERQWIVDEFVRRGMVRDEKALQVNDPSKGCLERVDLGRLVTSDWGAYDFANSKAGRELLCIPPRTEFRVEPRFPVEKKFYHRTKDGQLTEEMVREYLFKVWWYQEEQNDLGRRFPAKRQIAVGTTLAWDRDTGAPRMLLTSDPRGRPEEEEEQRKNRHLMLGGLAAEGLLQTCPQKVGPDGRPLRMVVSVEGTDRVMRVANVARMLNIMK